MKSFFSYIVLALLLVVPSFGSKIVEDSKKRFVLEDNVLETSIFACESPNTKRGRFLPEGSFFEDGNAVPFRYYRVALPANKKPRVSVVDKKTVPLGVEHCSDDPLRIYPVTISEPFLKDGLWMSDVRIPLYVKLSGGVALRKDFKIQVDFEGVPQGVNPGKRALSRVENPSASSRFGIPQAALRKQLRKTAAGSIDDVNFLTEFRIGDKNLSSFEEDGLYAVDYRTVRNALRLVQRSDELDGIELDKICLFSASQDTLSAVGPGLSDQVPNQLFEVPIRVIDHSPSGSMADGIFNDGDTLLFVGYGTSFWKRSDREDESFVNGKMDYFYSYSPYSFYQHFLLGYKSSQKALRMDSTVRQPVGNGKDVEWMRYVRTEKDKLLRDSYYGRSLDWESTTGKEWFWMWHGRYDTTKVLSSELYTDENETLPGLVEGGSQYISVTYFPHRSVWASTALVEGDQRSDLTFSANSYADRMSYIRFVMNSNGNESATSATTLIPGGNFRIDNPGLKSKGNQYSLTMLPNENQYDRFDGFTVAYQWHPTVQDAEWLLPGKYSGVIRVPVQNGVEVMKFVNLRPVGLLSAKDGFAKDSISNDDDVRYLAYRTTSLRSQISVVGIPKYSEAVLRDLSNPSTKMEYLIVAPEVFLDHAVALAEFRSDGSAVSTIPTSVVAAEDIYRRYTGGSASPVAIRNYIAYARSVCPNLKYVLLAGSGNYDYRGFSSKLTPNHLPPFEFEDTVTEDFFAVLDSGEMVRYGQYDLDMIVGRLPVQTVEDFDAYLQKVKDYEKIGVMNNSKWRSTLLLAADDAKNSGNVDYTKHTVLQENLANALDTLSMLEGFRWNLKKIYLLDYKEDAAGQKKDAADNFLNIMNQGALFTTYFGHGSKTDWASEGLLKPSYLSRLSNKGLYTILSSFSCTVGRFDEGNAKSLSEEFVLARDVGAILSVGSARETFATYNEVLAVGFLKNALINKEKTVGDALFKVKENAASVYSRQRYNNEHYLILGEPVIHLPQANLNITLDTKLDTLKALDKMIISGTVSGMQNGFVDVELTEGRTKKMLDMQLDDGDSVEVTYDGQQVFSEEIPVVNGRFSTEFVTPKKISIGDTAAEFKAWAYSPKSHQVGRLWKSGLVISGMSDYADSLNDNTPPDIQIQLCSSADNLSGFANWQEIQLQSPACLQVLVNDSTALDYREQADEGITFEIAGVQEPFHPWPYVEQTSKRAKIRMNFTAEQYPAGLYIFKVSALDVVGNVSTKTVFLRITDDLQNGLADVYNAPNPMGKKGTTFYFKSLSSDARVNIYI